MEACGIGIPMSTTPWKLLLACFTELNHVSMQIILICRIRPEMILLKRTGGVGNSL